MHSKTNRRNVLAGIGAGTLALALPQTALALNTQQARQLIDTVVGEINSVINSGKSETSMLRDFEKLFARYADVPIIARSALGVTARSASPAELRAFTNAFQTYISRKYGKRFREFIGGRLEVQEARAVKSFYEVKAMAFLRGESPFDVTFLVSDKSGRDLFFNIYIEGINMLATERTEIGAMLDRRKGDVSRLIEDLKTAA